MKIRTKLIMAHLIVVLLLLGSLTYVLVERSGSLVYDRVVENAELSLAQVSQNLDSKLESYEEFANTLFLNTDLNLILDQRYAEELEAYEVYSLLFKPYLTAVRATKDIVQVNVYTDNPSFLFSNVILIDDDIRASDWYRRTLDSRTGGYWTGPRLDFLETAPVISFRKRLNNVNKQSPSVVSLDIRLSKLTELIDEESKNKRFIFTLADGTVVIDQGGPEGAEPLDRMPFAGTIMRSQAGSLPENIGGQSYQVVYRTLDSRNSVSGMKVVSFVPVSELTPKVRQLRSLAYGLFAAAFALSALFIFAITFGLTRRLTELSSKMKRVHKDNFQSFVEVKGRDEVAQLGDMFNRMVQRVGQLIQEVYQAEIDRKEQAYRMKEAELYALQTQINPHFLFNVLNMIRGKLLIVGERDTAKVVGLLAKSFRMMLRSEGQTIRLADELEFVDNYLQIQQYRFGHKFTYAIDVPASCRDVFVPKLCLQPLVENSITHGIELNPEPCRIWIAGEARGGALELAVGDDGLGMAPERLAEVRGWLGSGDSLRSGVHIGLRNVDARLKSLYGPDGGLTIDSEPGRGTKLRLSIPLQPQSQRNGGDGNV